MNQMNHRERIQTKRCYQHAATENSRGFLPCRSIITNLITAAFVASNNFDRFNCKSRICLFFGLNFRHCYVRSWMWPWCLLWDLTTRTNSSSGELVGIGGDWIKILLRVCFWQSPGVIKVKIDHHFAVHIITKMMKTKFEWAPMLCIYITTNNSASFVACVHISGIWNYETISPWGAIQVLHTTIQSAQIIFSKGYGTTSLEWHGKGVSNFQKKVM